MNIQGPSGSGVGLFLWVRLRMWRARALELLHSPIKGLVITAAWTVLLGGIYFLALRGLRFLYETAGLGPFLLSRLWFLFLFIVTIMLAISQLAGAYSSMVRSSETRWWMTLPVSARTLCRAKWLESSFYSAWAVVLLVIPVCLADLIVLKKPLWLVSWVAVGLLTPLLGIATALATLLLLVWLRWFGRFAIRREVILVGFVVACALLFWMLGERRASGEQDAWFVALQGLLPRMQVAMSPWLPSAWVATALDAGLHERWRESLRYTGLLWTTMLVCWRLLDHAAAGLLLPVLRAHAHATEAGSGRSRPPRRARMAESPTPPLRHGLRPWAAWWSRISRVGGMSPPWGRACRGHELCPLGSTFGATWWMRHPLGAALVKDVLLILRDPMQWSQGVVFFGLLGAYFSNVHRLAQLSVEPSWRIGVASLHLACTLLVFGSLAVRFIFPQMSLEGRSLWLMRMAPNGMRRLLGSKLCLYGVFAVLTTEGLLMLSATRLGVPIAIRWWLASVGVMASLAIVGLTVGLGAWWIDLTAQDAARVVSSSNGALVLVFMLGYVGCVVGALMLAWANWLGHPLASLIVSGLALLAISAIVGVVPVRGGAARLETLEWKS